MRLAELAADDREALDLSRAGVARTGRRILAELVAAVTGTRSEDGPVHAQLAAHWRLDPIGADLVRRCLVLLADHELNASTFVARCVASTGASPYAAVSAALGALSGHRHGGASSRVEAAFHELKAGGDPIMAMAGRLFRGEEVPSIGHPLYPDGDPRAVAILYALSVIVPHSRRLVGRQPNVDFALGAATTALELPQGAALSLFVIGRTVGWIAHAIEQYESGVLIRPRAHYTGPRPAEKSTT
jgi:citrate synthase